MVVGFRLNLFPMQKSINSPNSQLSNSTYVIATNPSDQEIQDRQKKQYLILDFYQSF